MQFCGFVLSNDNNNNKSPKVIILMTKRNTDGARCSLSARAYQQKARTPKHSSVR